MIVFLDETGTDWGMLFGKKDVVLEKSQQSSKVTG